MSKGNGGSHGGGGAGSSPIQQAVAAINKIGLGSRYVKYSREGWKGSRASAFAGASKSEVQAIALGKAPTKDWGKRFDPVKVRVDYTRPGRATVSIEDGRHRMRYAKAAGATKIRAEVTVSRKVGGKWVESKPVVRVVKL